MRTQQEHANEIRVYRESLRIAHRRLSECQSECSALRTSMHKHQEWARIHYEQQRDFMRVDAEPGFDNIWVEVRYKFNPSRVSMLNKENFYKWIHEQLIRRLEQAMMKAENKHLV